MMNLAQFFLSGHVGIYRLTSGKIGGRMFGNTVLLLDHVGRKSKQRFTLPVMFFRDNGNYVIAASNGGAAKNPGWYHNLKANPRTTIQVMGDKINVVAEEAAPQERDRLWQHLITISPQFKSYETKTTRMIPLFILRPTGA